jgi:hypothetical protein
MRIPKRLLLGAALAATAMPPATAQEFAENLPQAPWFRQFQRELRAAWMPPNLAIRGPVRFVIDNDRWQPGRQLKSGNTWLALACDGNDCRLVPASLKVKRQRADEQYLHFDTEIDKRTRVIAWFATDAALPWLAAGPVATYFSGGSPPRPAGRGTAEVVIDLPGGETAVLMPMLLSAPDPSTPRTPPALLLLRIGERRQLLLGQLNLCISYDFQSQKYVRWAGDLDRDGKPDFLIDFVDGDGPIHLYLSSTAKPQRLVGLAGTYVAWSEATCVEITE